MSADALIDVPYADVRASSLSYVLGIEPLDALKTLALRVAGVDCELRILGCSHQVLLDDGALLSETVACLPDRADDAPLAREHRTLVPGRARYHFRSRVLPLAAHADRLDALVADHAAEPLSLVGLFPGHPHAFTALSARPSRDDAVVWETLHAYPQSGELVHTRSVLEPIAR